MNADWIRLRPTNTVNSSHQSEHPAAQRPYPDRVQVNVLGPTDVRVDGAPVDLGSPKRRTLLTALVLAHPRAVSVDTLIDQLWPDAAPPSVLTTLQAYVSGLRRVLEPHRRPREPATVLLTQPPGYALTLTEGASDVERFVSVVRRVYADRARFPDLPTDALTSASSELGAALALWRGTAYQDLGDTDAAVAERARLDDLRILAEELRTEVALALGQHHTVIGDLELLTDRHPLRENLWRLRALALARAGRQADALAAIADLRRILDTELGLEPGPEIRDLQAAILGQDSEIAWRPTDDGPATIEVSATRAAPDTREAAVDTPEQDRLASAPLWARLPWPTVGRGRELDLVGKAWERSRSGRMEFVIITGEPGIGKSRMAAESLRLAALDGYTVATARCSQDDGAPPLWPWSQVLSQWGREIDGDPHADDSASGARPDDGAAFRMREGIVAQVRDEARRTPALIVVDDLHWADPSTLRVLQLLAEADEAAPLTVVLTWRAPPEPTGALAELSEALGRHHATRIELTGLPAGAVADVVEGVSSAAPTSTQADDLAARTDGNPFFVVEYARLAEQSGDLATLLSEQRPPAAVGEIISRRVARLPEETRRHLSTAAVLGRSFDLDTLADLDEVDADTLLDLLEPAVAVGLLREEGIGAFLFAHALVRDTLYGSLRSTRRARIHARAAVALSTTGGHDSEVARHWMAAGPTHRGDAWRAAVAAAHTAEKVFAHEESAALYSAALETLVDDPTATDVDEFDVALSLAESLRRSGDWSAVVGVIERAIGIARRIGDAEYLARAAIVPSQGSIWFSAFYGQQNDAVVDALRDALDTMPQGDSVMRTQTLLALSVEVYYTAPLAERRALLNAATEMAARIGDDALELQVDLLGHQAIWSPRTAHDRCALTRRARDLARRLGDESHLVHASTLYANALSEIGATEEMWPIFDEALAGARRLRQPFPELVVLAVSVPWHLMAGRAEIAQDMTDRYVELAGRLRFEQVREGLLGILAAMAFWSGTLPDVADALVDAEDGHSPNVYAVAAYLIRAGRPEAARIIVERRDGSLDHDYWYSLLEWATAAEVALHLDMPDIAARAYELMAPLAGQSVSAGTGSGNGPVDIFLAFAAAAVGDSTLASRHAEHADALMHRWQIPLAQQWFARQRDRFGF